MNLATAAEYSDKRAAGIGREPISKEDLTRVVEEVLGATPFIDIHTHLFAPGFGELGLWGIDNLLTYHYLEAELFRFSSICSQKHWLLSKSEKADLIWKTLFVGNAPISEATRGVVAVLNALGLDAGAVTLTPLREFFQEVDLTEHISSVFRLAGIEKVVMTNDLLDPDEARFWDGRLESDPRFCAALRLDRLVNGTENQMASAETRHFIERWAARIRAVYMAVSLPDTFQFPADDRRTQLIADAVLPACRELNIPLALMIGVRRRESCSAACGGRDPGGACDWLLARHLSRGISAAICRRRNGLPGSTDGDPFVHPSNRNGGSAA